jgi:hypothetical protein
VDAATQSGGISLRGGGASLGLDDRVTTGGPLARDRVRDIRGFELEQAIAQLLELLVGGGRALFGRDAAAAPRRACGRLELAHSSAQRRDFALGVFGASLGVGDVRRAGLELADARAKLLDLGVRDLHDLTVAGWLLGLGKVARGELALEISHSLAELFGLALPGGVGIHPQT